MYIFVSNMAKNLIRGRIRRAAQPWIVQLQIFLARRAFHAQTDRPEYLGRQELAQLQSIYQRTSDKEYSYDAQSLQRRGTDRADRLAELFPRHLDDARQVVELGCGDGMTLSALARVGRTLIGIDHSADRFDTRASGNGVIFVHESASRIDLPDESTDIVFSFNAFEHFGDPASVYSEIKRILKPGGIFYTDFGPLYNSPWGLHGYDAIHVPFCQHMFQKSDMHDYCLENNLPVINFEYVNEYSHREFARIFDDPENIMNTRFFETSTSTHGIDLLLKYPHIFSGKARNFDEFLNSSIELLQQKSPNQREL